MKSAHFLKLMEQHTSSSIKAAPPSLEHADCPFHDWLSQWIGSIVSLLSVSRRISKWCQQPRRQRVDTATWGRLRPVCVELFQHDRTTRSLRHQSFRTSVDLRLLNRKSASFFKGSELVVWSTQKNMNDELHDLLCRCWFSHSVIHFPHQWVVDIYVGLFEPWSEALHITTVHITWKWAHGVSVRVQHKAPV